MKKLWIAVAFCLGMGPFLNGAVLEKKGIFYQFGTPELAIRINGRTGAWCRLSSGDKILADGARNYAFHLKTGDNPSKLRHLKENKVVSIRQSDPDTLEVTVQATDGSGNSRSWLVRCFYRFEKADSLVRSYELTCEGEGGEKVRGFSQRSPYLKLSGDDRVMIPMQTGNLELYRPGDIRSKKCKESWGRFGLAQLGDVTLVMEGVYHPEHSEWPSIGTLEDNTGFQFGSDLRILGPVKAGRWEKLGEFRTFLRKGSLDQTLRSLNGHLAAHGVLPPEGRPEWLRSAVFYSLPVNGSIAGAPYSRNGFSEMREVNLPYVRALGCNLYHLLPVETGSMYCAVDYFKLHEKSGTPEDYRAFVNAAHQCGVRVFQDIVPHGGMVYPKWGSKVKSKRAVEMEPLTIVNENGKRQLTLIFDYDMPQWQAYMGNVAGHLMKNYGLDGLRIDAVSNATGYNWRPGKTVRVGTSYCRAGGAMQQAIRSAARQINGNAGVLAESASVYHNSISDVLYDFTLYCHVLPKIENTPAEKLGPFFRNFFHQQYFATPGHALFMHYVESHDTVGAEARWSLRSMRALFAVTIWSYGTPMVYDEGAHGSGELFRKILHLRRDLPEMTRAVPEYLVPQVPGEIYTMLACGKDAASIPLVNLSDRKLDFTLKLDRDALPEPLRESRSVHDYWNSAILPVENSGKQAAVKVTLPPYGMTLLRFEKKPAEVEQDPAVSGQAELRPEVRFLDPDGMIREQSRFFELVWKGDTMTLGLRPPFDRRNPLPEGGLLLRLPLGAKERCLWEAGSIHGVHQDQYRVRFPNSPGVLTGSRFYLPVDHNVLWSSLIDPFGLTEKQAFVNFRTAKGTVQLTFDPAELPGHAAILDRVGKDQVPYLFIGFNAGRGTLKGAARPVLRWKIGKAPECPVFAKGSGDDRFSDHPGCWRYDDGKLRAEIGRSGMLRSVEVRTADKWVPAAGELTLKLSRLWPGSSQFFSSAEVLESVRRLEKLADGTLVFAVAAMPRFDFRKGFWGNDRIGEYTIEYRFRPDATMEIYAGVRCPGSEYAPDFSAELSWPGRGEKLCKVQVPADWKTNKAGWMVFSSGIPASKIGRWQWLAAAVGVNAASAKLVPPTHCREYPFEYCLDGEFEQEGLSALRQTVQIVKPFYDHIHMTAAPEKEYFTTSVGMGYFLAECANPHAGNYALGIQGKAGESRFSLQPLRKNYFKPGSRWSFRGFLRGEKLQCGSVSVGTMEKGRFVPLAGTGKVAGSFNWKEYRFQFRVPKQGKLYCRIENQGDGVIFADSFSFRPDVSASGSCSFLLRANDAPQLSCSQLKKGSHVLSTDGPRHTFCHPDYELTVNRARGGDACGISYRGKTLIASSRVFSDDGFFFPEVDHECGKIGSSANDPEAGLKVEELENGVSLDFLSRLKKDEQHHRPALPLTDCQIRWQPDDSARIRYRVSVDAAALQPYQLKWEKGASEKNLKGTLRQEFQLSGLLAEVKVRMAGKVISVPLKNAVEDRLYRTSEIPDELTFYDTDGKLALRMIDFKKAKDAVIEIVRRKGMNYLQILLLNANGRKQPQKAEFSCDFILKMDRHPESDELNRLCYRSFTTPAAFRAKMIDDPHFIRCREAVNGPALSEKEALAELRRLKAEVTAGINWQTPLLKTTIPFLAKAPVIDGEIRPEEWKSALKFDREYLLDAEKPLARSNAIWHLGYNGKYLFFAAQIRNAAMQPGPAGKPYYGDSVEIFLHPDKRLANYVETVIGCDGQCYQANCRQSPKRCFDLEPVAKPQVKAVVKPDGSGYCVEGRIPFAALPGYLSGNAPKPGESLNFMLLCCRLDAKKQYRRTTPYPFLYDGHNIYGYIQGTLGK